jgi:hypothetical protein
MTTPIDTPALMPPDPDRDGWHWASYPGLRPVPLFWVSKAQLWIIPGPGIAPDVAAKAGYTFATDPPHPIPSAAALERLYALATPPTGPATPASSFAVGYVAGMGYVADKLRAALEDR